jgi:hypothetical protein
MEYTADDWCGNDRLCQEPGKRHLGARDVARIGDFGHAIDNLLLSASCVLANSRVIASSVSVRMLV